MKKTGTVYLVGAGPGDTSLLTLRGCELLKKADVVLYDYLANPALLNFTSEKCKKIYVGKKGSDKNPGLQESIQDELLACAKKYKTVVRLKGGDSFIFGRGGEEAEFLKQNKIPFEIIPGVSSISSVPAYAGIPLTHRDFASNFCVLTGHCADNNQKQIPWPHVASFDTVVILMATAHLNENLSHLMNAGKSPATPAALISWGSYPHQKTVVSTLQHLARDAAQIKPPAVVVVGEVVSLRDKLKWFEEKPLFGKKVLITRAGHQNSQLAYKLSALGAQVLDVPLIKVVPQKSKIKNIDRYDWLVLTSANAVEHFFKHVHDARDLAHVKIAVIGSATAETLKTYGLKADLMPKKFVAEGLIDAFKKKRINRKKILIPRAQDGREELVEGLKALKNKVDTVTLYKTLPETKNKEALLEALNKNPDWTLFLSSSSVHAFYKMVSCYNGPIACLGPVTAKTARSYGLKVDVVAKDSVTDSLIKALF
ncbi:uroporphyrinogen-III C-methyltransferase [bacterium]|nr:uroporphyrinogen-III C-methyltransferase [bacterium]